MVGLSTARLDGHGGCRIDGFTHRDHATVWQDLIQAVVDWNVGIKASHIYADVSVEDEEKRALFESLEFSHATEEDSFDLGGRQVSTVRLAVS